MRVCNISFFSEVEGVRGDGEDGSGGGNGDDGDGSLRVSVGAITGAVCGLYGIYVAVGSASALIIYWLFLLMASIGVFYMYI